MTTFLGADTDALRDLSDTFGDRAQRLVELAEELLASVGAVSWMGPDADSHRAECTAVLGDLTARAGDVTTRGRDLLAEAEQQDRASEPGTAGGGSGGAWSPDGFDLSDIAPWLVPGKPSTVQERAEEVVKDLVDSYFERRRDQVIDRLVEASDSSLARFAKKWVPVVPDAFDAVRHAANGETEEMTYAISRAALDTTPLGTADAISSQLFPYAPDDWLLPGTDQPLNEGSLFEGYEKMLLDSHDTYDDARIEGEQYGLELSDRLGIENETGRNLMKSYAGLAAMVGRAHRDPADPDKPWIFAVDEPTQDKIRDLLP